MWWPSAIEWHSGYLLRAGLVQRDGVRAGRKLKHMPKEAETVSHVHVSGHRLRLQSACTPTWKERQCLGLLGLGLGLRPALTLSR